MGTKELGGPVQLLCAWKWQRVTQNINVTEIDRLPAKDRALQTEYIATPNQSYGRGNLRVSFIVLSTWQ